MQSLRLATTYIYHCEAQCVLVTHSKIQSALYTHNVEKFTAHSIQYTYSLHYRAGYTQSRAHRTQLMYGLQY